MAKAAKEAGREPSERDGNKAIEGVLVHFGNIETARGKFMNAARREREGMATIYENLAAKGVPQDVAKLEVQIARMLLKLKGKVAELDSAKRKQLQKLARGYDKTQMSLFADLPPAKEPEEGEEEGGMNVINIERDLGAEAGAA
jgi:hypothetical protein